MTELHIPGIRRIKIVDNDGHPDHKAGAFHYAINLQELTEEVAFGLPGHQRDSGTRRDEWSHEEIAQIIFEPSNPEFVAVGEIEALISATEHLLADCVLNDAAAVQARTDAGYASRRTDPTGAELGPTILYIPEEKLRQGRRSIAHRYRALAAERIFPVELPGIDIRKRLLELRSLHLDHLENTNRELVRQSQPVEDAAARVQSAIAVMNAMIDFTKSSSERRALWATDDPKETEEFVLGRSPIPQQPTPEQEANALFVRDRTLTPILGALTETVQWMRSGASVEGSVFTHAQRRDVAANNLLLQLRTEPVVLSLLKNHEFVDTITWIIFDKFLRDSFALILTSPKAAEDLFSSELLGLARVLARPAFGAAAKGPQSKREVDLLARINSLVPETDLAEQPTELSEALKELAALGGKLSTLTTHTPTAVTLFSIGLPAFAPLLTQRVRTSRGNRWLDARAVMFRAAASSIAEVDHQALWDNMNRIARNGLPPQGALLDRRLRRSARGHLGADTGTKALKVLLATLALYETAAENSDKPAAKVHGLIDKSIALVSAGAGLAEAAVKSSVAMGVTGRHSDRLFKALDGINDTKGIKTLGLFGSWMGIMSSIMSVNLADTKSWIEKDIELEKIIFSIAQFAIAAAEFAIGTSMPITALVLCIVQTFLEHREDWLPEIFDNVEGLHGTGKYVREVARHLRTPELERHLLIESARTELNAGLSLLGEFTRPAAPPSQRAFWALSAGELITPSIVARVLVRQYGLDPEGAAKAVGR